MFRVLQRLVLVGTILAASTPIAGRARAQSSRQAGTLVGRLDFPGAGPQGLTLSGDGRILYQSLSQQDRVVAIDLASYEIVGYFQTGDRPDGIGYSSLELVG